MPDQIGAPESVREGPLPTGSGTAYRGAVSTATAADHGWWLWVRADADWETAGPISVR